MITLGRTYGSTVPGGAVAKSSAQAPQGAVVLPGLDDSLAAYQEAPMEGFNGLQRMVNRGDAVRCVLINGRIAYRDGEFASDLGQVRGYGQFLRAGTQ